MSYVDEKIAKITLENKSFEKNADQTIKTLERLKKAFNTAGDTKAAQKVQKEMDALSNGVSKSVQKSESLLSKLGNIFKKTASNIDMSGATKSVDKMNTDIANKTAKTSDILSRLKGIFQKADTSEGFPNIISGVDKLNSKIANVDASPISSTFSSVASSVQNSISVMDIALGNFIGNAMTKMAGFGKQFLKGHIDGYAEYANKMTSIQTIMTNTESAFGGDRVRQMMMVNRTLADLNEYADQTIYSFADMTRNIGTFTAAGVGLEDSAVAIKGIANLAAASGSSSQQAGVAMYQLSQAIASGRVALMDWNSVVNAGMGGELFKNALMETGKAMGKTIDQTKTFRDTLQDGWLTADVLIATLKKFSVDESMVEAATKVKTFTQLIETTQEAIGSGWADTWEHIFGNLEEAKGLWSDIAGSIADYLDDNQGKYFDSILQMERNLGNFRNAMLKTWKDGGGQKAFFEGLQNSVKVTMKTMDSFRQGWRATMGDYKTQAAELIKITTSFRDFSKSLLENETLQKAVNSAGSAFASVFKTAFSIVGRFSSGIRSVSNSSGELLSVIEKIMSSIRGFFDGIRSNEKLMQSFENFGKIAGNVFKIFSNVFQIAAIAVMKFFSAFNLGGSGGVLLSFSEILLKVSEGVVWLTEKIKNAVSEGEGFKIFGMIIHAVFSGIAKVISSLFGKTAKVDFSWLSDGLDILIKKLSGFGDGLAKIGKSTVDILGKVFKGMSEGASKGWEELKNAFKEMDLGGIIKAIIASFSLLKWAQYKYATGDSIIDRIKDFFDKNVMDKLLESITGITDGIGGALENFGNSLNAFSGMVNATKLVLIASAVLMLTISMEKLSKIEMKDLSKGMIGIGAAALVLFRGMKQLSQLSSLSKGLSPTMIAMAFAIRILVGALKSASEIESDRLQTAIAGIVTAMLTLTSGMKLMSKVGTVEVGIVKMIGLALSMKILASILSSLNNFKPDQMFIAVSGLVSVMLTLAGGMKILDNVKIKMSTMFGLISLSIAMKLLASSLVGLSKMDTNAMTGSVLGLSSLMLSLVGAIKIIEKTKVSPSSMISMLLIVTMINQLVKEVEKLSKMKFPEMFYAISGVSGLLLALGGAARIISDVKVDISTVPALLAFTASIYGLTLSIQKLSKIDKNSLVNACMTIGIILTSLIASVHLIQNVKVNMGAMLSLTTITAGVYLVVSSMEKIAKMPLEEISKSGIIIEAILLSLVGMTRLISNAKISMTNMLMMIGLVGSVYLLIGIIKDISELDPIGLVAASTSISAIILSIGLSVKMLNGMGSSIQSAAANAVLLQSFSELLKNVANSLKDLSTIDWEKLAISTAAIFGVLVGMVLLTKATKGIDMGDIGGLLTLASTMKTIAESLSMLANYSWQQIATSVGALGGTLLLLTASVKLLTSMDNVSKGTGQLFILAGALLALAIPIKILSTIGWVGVAAGMAAMAGSLSMLLLAGSLARFIAPGLMSLSSAMLSFAAASTLASFSLLIAATSFALITTSIVNLVKVAPEAMKAITDGFTHLVDYISKNADSIVDGLVKGAKAAIRGMREVLPDFVAFGFDAITHILKGLSKSMPQLISAAVEFVVEFAKGLVQNAVILVQAGIELIQEFLVGILDALPGLVSTISMIAIQFCDLLATELEKNSGKMAESFSRLLQQVVVLLGPIFTDLLGPLAEIFVKAMEPALNSIIDLMLKAAPVLIPVIQSIADIIQTVADAIVRTVEAIAPHIVPIIDAIRGVIEAVAPVVIEFFRQFGAIVEAVAPVVIALIDAVVAGIIVLGGIVNNVINGIISIVTTVGNVIITICTSIVAAIEGVAHIFESIAGVIQAAFEGVGTVIESVGKSIKSVLEGVGDVIEKVGGSIRTVLDGIAGIFDSIGEAALNTGRGFEKVADGVGKIMSYNVFELGANLGAVADAVIKLSNQSEQMTAMGTSMSSLASSLMVLGTNGMTAMMILTNLSTLIPTISQSILTLPTGVDQAILAFQNLGIGIQNGVTLAIPMAIMAIQTLIFTIQNSVLIVQQGGMMMGQAFGMMIANGILMGAPFVQTNSMTLATMAISTIAAILNGGQAISIGFMFGSSVASGIASNVAASSAAGMALSNAAVSGVRGGFSSAVSIGNQFGSGVRGGITSTIGQNTSAGNQLASNVVNVVRNGFSPANSIGVMFGSQVSNGLRSKIGDVSSAASTLSETGRTTIEKISWFNSGAFLAEGLANGILSMSGYVMRVAYNLANRAAEAIRKALVIRSPSRVTFGLGEFFGEGFVNGIASMIGHAITRAKSLANKTVDAIVEGTSMIESELNDRLDLNPTITPVIDLSNMRDLDMNARSRFSIETRGINRTPNNNQGQSITNNSSETINYNVTVNATEPQNQNARKLAREIQAEIKREHDRTKFSRGEHTSW